MRHRVKVARTASFTVTDTSNSSADAALFRATVGQVNPIKPPNKITPRTPQLSVFPRQNYLTLTTLTNNLSDCSNELALSDFLRNGLSRLTLRKLRRGQPPIQDRLDLHGSTSDAARQLLFDFVHDSVRAGQRCILIIHGKGLNSQRGEAVLKLRTRHWLTQLNSVLAFCDAPIQEGGSGAVLVLLRTKL